MNKNSSNWERLVYKRLMAVKKDVTVAEQLFVNTRSYEFEKADAEKILTCIDAQLKFVKEAYMMGTPANVQNVRVTYTANGSEDPGLSKKQKSFIRLANRRIGIRLLPHMASVGTASRRTSYDYPYDLGILASDTLSEIVQPLIIIIKKSIDEDYALNRFKKMYDDFCKVKLNN